MEELRKCPFCGGEAEMHYGIFTDDAYVECIECKARSHVFFENNSAIVAWNRRVTQNIGKKECCEHNEEQEG